MSDGETRVAQDQGRAETVELIFRCPRELHGILPPPIPALRGIPDWFKSMPAEAFSPLVGAVDDTVKRCPPFIDAMTHGYLMSLACDLRVEDGEFSWEFDLPPCSLDAAPRSPIGIHDASQVAGTPLFDADRFLLKFHNFWTIQTPPGWSMMFSHPANRLDLPFRTLSGLVATDRYHQTFVHFPAVWVDPDFSGLLPAGTPVAQCIPVRRSELAARIEPFEAEHETQARVMVQAIAREKNVYRKRFRV